MTPLRGGAHYDRAAMTDPVHDLAAARRAWRSLERAGGLVSNADLRVRWGGADGPLARQTVQKLTAREDFPKPVIRGGRGVPDQWLAAEVDDWRRRYDAGVRPGRTPRANADTE